MAASASAAIRPGSAQALAAAKNASTPSRSGLGPVIDRKLYAPCWFRKATMRAMLSKFSTVIPRGSSGSPNPHLDQRHDADEGEAVHHAGAEQQGVRADLPGLVAELRTDEIPDALPDALQTRTRRDAASVCHLDPLTHQTANPGVGSGQPVVRDHDSRAEAVAQPFGQAERASLPHNPGSRRPRRSPPRSPIGARRSGS